MKFSILIPFLILSIWQSPLLFGNDSTNLYLQKEITVLEIDQADWESATEGLDYGAAEKQEEIRQPQKIEGGESRKIELIKKAIKMCLKRSDYTNIYTYLNADELHKHKSELLTGKFNTPIRITEFKEEKTILANYNLELESGQIKKILKKNKMMIAMNKIFEFVVDRDFEEEQKLTLDLRYEDKEEWGTDRDNLNISIQLEKL